MPNSNCYKCGRFIGKDGNLDISYDEYDGGYEQGYPEYGKCIRGETIIKKVK